MYILSVCGSSGILKIIAFMRIILNIVFIVIPVGLILMVSIDFSKAVLSGDSSAVKKIAKLALNRILSAVFLFSVPYIITLFIHIVGNMGSDYANCILMSGDTNAIAALEKLENDKKEAEAAAKAKEIEAQAEKNRQAIEAQRLASQNARNYSGSGASTIKGEGCDGVVYYEDGTFYKPSQSLVPQNGIPKTKGSATAGYNKYFYEYLEKFVEAAKKEGYTITPSPNEGDGAWRSFERQQYWWEHYGHDNNRAAVPGTSNHGWAIASDLSFGDTNSLYWAHDHANEYNLRFPICQNVRTGPCVENWHIEPLSLVVDDERAKVCVN